MASSLPVLLLSKRSKVAGAFDGDPGAFRYRLTVRPSSDKLNAESIASQYPIVFIDLATSPKGATLLRRLRKLNKEIQCAVIVDRDQERDGVSAVRSGAFDYQLWPPQERGELWELVGRCLKRAEPQQLDPFTPKKLGKYRLLHRIGAGGMAEVFLTEHRKKKLVVKRMLTRLGEKDEFVRMFMDEAKISSQLQHDNIVRVHDFGRSDHELYMVMEYVDGWSLEQLCRWASWTVPIPVALMIVAEVCKALDYAHEKTDSKGERLGIIHRDVNPPNVLIGRDGRVKLTDFGIAKAKSRYSESTSGLLKGKLSYMSPEQVDGSPLDHRADIFATGILLYKLLTGYVPFSAPSPFDMMVKIRNGQYDPAHTMNPKVSERLSGLLNKALERDPNRRYRTATEFEVVLRAHLTALGASGVALAEWAADIADKQGQSTVSHEVAVDEPSKADNSYDAFSMPPDLTPLKADTESVDKFAKEVEAAMAEVDGPSQPSGPSSGELVHRALGTAKNTPETAPNAPTTAPAGRAPASNTPQTAPSRPKPTPAEPEPIIVKTEHTSEPSIGPVFPSAAREPRRRRWMLWGMGGAGVLGLILLVVLVGRLIGGDRTRVAQTDPSPMTTVAATATTTPAPTTATPAAPSPTQAHTHTAAPTATATPVAAATPTARAAPTANATTAARATSTPRPTPRAVVKKRKGKLSIWTDVWAYVTVDGKRLKAKAPVFGLELSAGKHRIVLENPALGVRAQRVVTIRPNQESKLTVKLREQQ